MKLTLVLLMAAAAMQQPAQATNQVADGDPQFWKVDTRRPAHELPPGTAADAINKRFEDGRAWPRLGVQQGPWGWAGINVIPADAVWVAIPGLPISVPQYNIALVAGQRYVWIPGNTQLSGLPPNNMAPVAFIAQPGGYTLTSGPQLPIPFVGSLVSAAGVQILRVGNVCGYARFDDPDADGGQDVAVLLTDDWRDQAGEDGGRGRAWRIEDGNLPSAIPLNGNDVYGTARLIPCYAGLVMLRQQNERHYFAAAAVGNAGPGANTIQLNCQPAWNTGDACQLWFDNSQDTAFSAGANPPAPDVQVYVRDIGNNQVTLWSDQASALAGAGHQYLFTAAIGRFYLERQSVNPGPWGNGAPALIAQPDADGNIWSDVGFVQVPDQIEASAVANNFTVTAANHRLVAGDSVYYYSAAGTVKSAAWYAYPLNGWQVNLYTTQWDALGNTGANEANVPNFTPGDYLVKTTASGLPMPPAREGFFAPNNRLVLVNGSNNLIISDPNDPLHYSPLVSQLTANLGEADPVTGLNMIGDSDALVILKERSIMVLYSFSQFPNGSSLLNVTREYGCVAPLSITAWGASLMFLSRRGLDRVVLTAFDTILPQERPVSWDMKKYTDRIDWVNAPSAVADNWNNRLFLALPLKGPAPPAGQNNAVLALNLLNSEPAKDEFGWEGLWSGAALGVAGFARLTIGGEERLSFVNYAAQACWLGDGALDLNVPVADSLTTRIYGKETSRKIWQQALVTLDHNNPTLAITASSPGWMENYLLTPAGGLTYNPNAYLDGSNRTYNPNTQVPPFNNPFRDDYALQGPGELIGGQPDVLQNKTEPFRLRIDDWGVQLTIANTTGQARIVAVAVEGFRGPSSARQRV